MRMVQQSELSRLREIQRPFSQTVVIEPGTTAIVVDERIILGGTTKKSRTLLIGHSTKDIISREDPNKDGGLRVGRQRQGSFDVAMEFLFGDQPIYVGDRYEIKSTLKSSRMLRLALGSSVPIRARIVSGNIDFKDYLGKLTETAESS